MMPEAVSLQLEINPKDGWRIPSLSEYLLPQRGDEQVGLGFHRALPPDLHQTVHFAENGERSQARQ